MESLDEEMQQTSKSEASTEIGFSKRKEETKDSVVTLQVIFT